VKLIQGRRWRRRCRRRARRQLGICDCRGCYARTASSSLTNRASIQQCLRRSGTRPLLY
jgi:hypothetical protein